MPANNQDVLLKMSEQLGSLTAQVESHGEKLEKIDRGVEDLKGWKSRVIGMATVVGALVSVAVTWATRHLTLGGSNG